VKFKLDGNLPTSAAAVLASAGHDTDTVVAEGLAGAPDPDVVLAAARLRVNKPPHIYRRCVGQVRPEARAQPKSLRTPAGLLSTRLATLYIGGPGGREFVGSPRDLCDLGASFGEDLHQLGGLLLCEPAPVGDGHVYRPSGQVCDLYVGQDAATEAGVGGVGW
jgi:hypothetical protein